MRSGSHCLRSCVIRGIDQRGVSPTLEGSPNFTTSQRLPTPFALLSPSLSSSRSRPQRHVLHSSLGLHSAASGLCLPSRSSLTTSFFFFFCRDYGVYTIVAVVSGASWRVVCCCAKQGRFLGNLHGEMVVYRFICVDSVLREVERWQTGAQDYRWY